MMQKDAIGVVGLSFLPLLLSLLLMIHSNFGSVSEMHLNERVLFKLCGSLLFAAFSMKNKSFCLFYSYPEIRPESSFTPSDSVYPLILTHHQPERETET